MELVLAPEGLIQLVVLLTDSGRGRLPPCAPLSAGAEPAGWIAAAGDAAVPPEGAGAERGGAGRTVVEDPPPWLRVCITYDDKCGAEGVRRTRNLRIQAASDILRNLATQESASSHTVICNQVSFAEMRQARMRLWPKEKHALSLYSLVQVTSLGRKGRRSQGKGVANSKTQHRVVGSSRLCRDSGTICRSGICGLYHMVEFIPRTGTGRAHLFGWASSLGSVIRARGLDGIGYPSAGCGVQRNRKAQGNVKDWKHMQQVRRQHHTSRAPIPGRRARRQCLR